MFQYKLLNKYKNKHFFILLKIKLILLIEIFFDSEIIKKSPFQKLEI